MPSSMASRPPAARRPLSVRKGVRRRQAVEAAHKRSRQVVAVGGVFPGESRKFEVSVEATRAAPGTKRRTRH